jgi:hypothetical protein
LLLRTGRAQVCDESQRERLLSRVRCYYEILKTSTFGKHIVNRLEKLLSAGMRIQVNSLAMPPAAAAVPAAAPAAAPAHAVHAPAPAAQQQEQQPGTQQEEEQVSQAATAAESSAPAEGCEAQA